MVHKTLIMENMELAEKSDYENFGKLIKYLDSHYWIYDIKETEIMSRKEFETTKKELKANGWTEEFSISKEGNSLRYGTLFLKDGVEFWLNKDTFKTYKGFNK